MYDHNDYSQHQQRYSAALHKVSTCAAERINLVEVVRIIMPRLNVSQLTGIQRLIDGIISYKSECQSARHEVSH